MLGRFIGAVSRSGTKGGSSRKLVKAGFAPSGEPLARGYPRRRNGEINAAPSSLPSIGDNLSARMPAALSLPRVGISSCLLGEPVRYDGGHRKQPALLDDFAGQVEWVASCPEAELGLGVPRETIQIELREGALALMTHDTRRDITASMRAWAQRRAAALAAMNISGYVFKARSPSCGVGSVAVVGGSNDGTGFFAAELIRQLPDLPVAEEDLLATRSARQTFLQQVHRYAASTV
jgi:uncharacterized protein YbbK (DUF523 family)